MNKKIAESLGAVHTHTHIVLLNKKINEINISSKTYCSLG